jgi:hypothetical protein
MLYWGFGPRVAVFGAMIIAIGFPWSYQWVGGSLGRHTWWMLACAGLALLRRERTFWGMFALTGSALLRLFPLVFVGGAGLYVLAGWIRKRSLSGSGARTLAAVALALALGIPAAGLAVGFDAYPDFVRVMQRHAGTPLTNHIGLQTLLGARAGQTSEVMADANLTDPYEPWLAQQRNNRRERRPLWIAATALSLAFCGWVAWRRRPIWECAMLGAPLLFCLLPMTSYDYMWLALLAVLAEHRTRRGSWLIGYALFTQLVTSFQPNGEVHHIYYTVGCLALLVALGWDVVRHDAPMVIPSPPETA